MSVDDERGRISSDFAGQVAVNELAETMSTLARTLQEEGSYLGTLQAIVEAAVDTVPHAIHAGATVVRGRRRVDTLAATSDLVNKVDRVQYDTGQGPCLHAAFERSTVRITDMTSEPRWPAFTGPTAGLGILSMLSFQLFAGREDMGALNLYSDRAGAFTDESEYIGLLLASHAAVAMADALEVHHLAGAVSNRDLIGQAKGILMERHRLTADQAFALLVRASQHTNAKLSEIARRLCETGELAAGHVTRQ
jgi:hypothetical protein